ncbi:MAG: hypothetical protein IT406_01205 [Candidatus Yanofskybacteria bacterium]|nr:hypothetical protein [Candidatus Yanofskybacteria bacterium]
MKKRTRRILFWFAVVVFFVATWVVIRYAQGYAYDWKSGQFVRTGAIAVTVNTSGQLFVDDRLSGSTSFLGNRAGQDRLLPGSYTVRLVRDGYSTWRKEAVVQEGLLTDFPSILLLPLDDAALIDLKREASVSLSLARLPSEPHKASVGVTDGTFALKGTTLWRTDAASASVVAESVLGFARPTDGSRVLWWTRNDLWVVWLRNTDYQPFHSEGDRQLITRISVPIRRAAWFRGRDHIVVDLGSQSYRVVEIDTRGGVNIIKL